MTDSRTTPDDPALVGATRVDPDDRADRGVGTTDDAFQSTGADPVNEKPDSTDPNVPSAEEVEAARLGDFA